MKRRDFLKQSAAGAAITMLGRVTPSIAADPTAKVALVRTEDRVRGIESALKQITFASPQGKRVLIKPNFNTADPTPGSTHNDTIRKLVEEMKARGAAGISVGDSCGPGNTQQVIEQKGIPTLAREAGFDVVNFDDLPEEGWVHFNPPGCHWQNGFHVAKPVVDAEYLLWTCCLKTHGFGGIHSMSLKLAVGVTKKESRFRDLHADDSTMRKKIAEIHHGFKPHLIVMDGMEIFTDGGPMNGTRVSANVIVAGTDRIAVDAVGLAILKHHGSNDRIMSTKIFEQEQIARAVEMGLGVKSPEQIDLITADAGSAEYAAGLNEILKQG